MTHTLSLEIPEELYEPLVQTAKKAGQTAEELATQWLLLAIHNTLNDPIEKIIGSLSTNIPNWADEHDRYLGLGQLIVEDQADKEDDIHA